MPPARETIAERVKNEHTFDRMLRERYGGIDIPSVVDETVIGRLLSHRSVRAYLDTPLPEHALESMIAAAQSASTSSNLQAWSAVAVSDPQRKAALSRLACDQRHIVEAPTQIVWLADLARLRAAAQRQGIDPRGLDYFELFLVGCIDAALAAQNAAVAAEALGLGVVFIGGMRDHPIEVGRLLGLPPGVFAVFGMCVGYPDDDRPAAIKPRIPQESVVFRETYSEEKAHGRIDDYDEIMEQFYTEHKMKQDRWSLRSAKRVGGPETLSGRDRLKSILTKMGFALK